MQPEADQQATATDLGDDARMLGADRLQPRRASCRPRATTWSMKPSASMTSSTALATVQANGLPPKVEPWVPAVMPDAARAVARQAPTGKPPPSPLAMPAMSGVTPACS